MAHYIDKEALVAEIESYKSAAEWMLKGKTDLEHWRSQKGTCEKLLSFVDTLEVKEVDLEKIINDYFKDWKFDEELDIMVKPNNYSATFDDIKEVAKHFFELGLSVSNKAQKGE